MTKKKVVIILDNLGSGGAQRLFVNLAKYLACQGHNVEFFIYSSEESFFDKELIDTGINIVRAQRAVNGFSLKILLALVRFLNNSKADAVIGVMHAPSIYTTLASLITGYSGKVSLCEVSSSNAASSKLRRLVFSVCTTLVDRVITNSYAEADLLAGRRGLGRNLEVIWNGYDLSKFRFCPSNSVSDLKLLVVGRVAYPKNGVNVLLAIQRFYVRNGFAPSVIWAGREDSDPLSRGMQNEMKALISDSEVLQKSVEFVGEVADIEPLYRESSALLHMSLYEGLPNVICEAMLFGCPVLASDVCDHPRVLGTHRERGLLADPTDPESICKCIEAFVNLNLGDRVVMINSARKFAEEHFDVDKMACAYLGLGRD